MKVVICGSRNLTDYEWIKRMLDTLDLCISEVISGGAKGVDLLGERWAKENNIPVKRFLPNWNKHGKKAGILRNIKMVDYADKVIAFWDGRSKGTKFTIEYAKNHHKLYRLYIKEVENDNQNTRC